MPNTQIIDTLSHSRMSTYLNAANRDPLRALDLYLWNSNVSAALLVPMHICEILVRNAVADIFVTQFGQQWPWQRSLELTLPKRYRNELVKARSKPDIAQRTSKVIPELTFNFWQQMFVSTYDQQFWQPYLHQTLPNAPANIPFDQLRGNLFNDLEKIRKLRNRIAHHEPIFKQNISATMDKIERLISYRCIDTANWVIPYFQVRQLIQSKPE